jgi:hypothetical protein
MNKMVMLMTSGMALSLTTGLKSADLVTGRNKYPSKGRITLIAKGSATGMNCTLVVGGITIVDDSPVMWFGTTGTMTSKDNVICDQVVAGGCVELFFRNPTGGTLTVDYALYFTPM